MNTDMQTDSSMNVIIDKCPLLLFLIQVDLKLKDLLSKTNCTAYKVKKLYERITEELDEIDKSYLTIHETNVMRNLQDLNSVCKEDTKDIVKVISGYYSSMSEQAMSTISCAGNLSQQTKYFTDLLTSFLALSSSFQKQSWFSDVFLESAWKWEPISFCSEGSQGRNAISTESYITPINQYENYDESNSSCSASDQIGTHQRVSLDWFDSRNTFSSEHIAEVDWKHHIDKLKRTSQSLDILEMKFFVLRSRDIHFLQTLSGFEENDL
ncbi:uncharacterized protein LOC111064308 [Nilaparvata lugens]|uniref:uncharacterized protein LOC111064308 n=1 Tax=Nilaparvata lugens TaxID=108931 RepID=UPI000B98D698|nr:uncharacterized protein LOC111064308 [Nilaparvata lugens]